MPMLVWFRKILLSMTSSLEMFASGGFCLFERMMPVPAVVPRGNSLVCHSQLDSVLDQTIGIRWRERKYPALFANGLVSLTW